MKRSGWFDDGIPDSAVEERCPICTKPVIRLDDGFVGDILSTKLIVDESNPNEPVYRRESPPHRCVLRDHKLFENGDLNEDQAHRLAAIEWALTRECPTCHAEPDSMCTFGSIKNAARLSQPHPARIQGFGHRIARTAEGLTSRISSYGPMETPDYMITRVRSCPKCKSPEGHPCLSLNTKKGAQPKPTKVPHKERYSDDDLFQLHSRSLLLPVLVKEMVRQELMVYENIRRTGITPNSSWIRPPREGEIEALKARPPYQKTRSTDRNIREGEPYHNKCGRCNSPAGRACVNFTDLSKKKANPRILSEPHAQRYTDDELRRIFSEGWFPARLAAEAVRRGIAVPKRSLPFRSSVSRHDIDMLPVDEAKTK